MSWDCQFRSSKPATCQLFTQPANYLLNLPTYCPTCKLFSQTCQLFPEPANILPKPANFLPNLPTFSLNLPTFSQTCQLLSQDLGGDPPPPDGHLSQPCLGSAKFSTLSVIIEKLEKISVCPVISFFFNFKMYQLFYQFA